MTATWEGDVCRISCFQGLSPSLEPVQVAISVLNQVIECFKMDSRKGNHQQKARACWNSLDSLVCHHRPWGNFFLILLTFQSLQLFRGIPEKQPQMSQKRDKTSAHGSGKKLLGGTRGERPHITHRLTGNPLAAADVSLEPQESRYTRRFFNNFEQQHSSPSKG